MPPSMSTRVRVNRKTFGICIYGTFTLFLIIIFLHSLLAANYKSQPLPPPPPSALLLGLFRIIIIIVIVIVVIF